MFRKIMIAIMVITFLFGCGIEPLMSLYNKDCMVGGIPAFFAGILAITGLLVAESIILYLVERDKDDENGNYRRY